MELKDTVPMMLSEDYKERFKAEYYQLKIRKEKLSNMLDNWDHLTFVPTCEKHIYESQLSDMIHLLLILEMRATKEGVVLPA